MKISFGLYKYLKKLSYNNTQLKGVIKILKIIPDWYVLGSSDKFIDSNMIYGSNNSPYIEIDVKDSAGQLKCAIIIDDISVGYDYWLGIEEGWFGKDRCVPIPDKLPYDLRCALRRYGL